MRNDALVRYPILARVGVGFGLSYVLASNATARIGRRLTDLRRGRHRGNRGHRGSSGQRPSGCRRGPDWYRLHRAGVVFKGRTGSVHGITTAATLFGVAGMGIVTGYGYLLPAVAVAAALLVMLELPNVPWLKRIEARTYAARFLNDPDLSAADASENANQPPPPPGPP